MPSLKPVVLGGRHLGDLKVVSHSDWTNRTKDPTPLDFEIARVLLAAQAVHEIMARHPRRPDGPDQDEAWPVTVLKAVCRTSKEREDEGFEEDVLRKYVEAYGMNQILESFGIDPARVAEQLDRLRRT